MNTSVLLWQSNTNSGSATIMNYVIIIAAMAIIYFMMIRPQSQLRKKQAQFNSSLKKGKKVVTTGGVHGTIAEINENTVELIVAPKTHLTFQREAISMDFTLAAFGQQQDSPANEKSTDDTK